MAKIKFEDGTIINFNGTPTEKDVEEVAMKLGLKKQSAPSMQIEQNKKSGISGTINKAKEFSKSAFKTAGNILEGAGKMLVNPNVNALQTGIMQPVRQVQKAIPGGKTGQETYQSPFGELRDIEQMGAGEKATKVFDVASVGLPIENIVKKPLTIAAQKLYGSALKARDIIKFGKVVTSADDITKIGLKEKIWLTQGGVEKVANRIDDFEAMLGDAIEAGKSKGGIAVNEVVKYVDEAREFFQNQANRKEAKLAMQYLDDLKKGFRKDFGPYMSLDKAQKVKVATGQELKKYYNTMSSSAIEGEKQLVRGLKEKIVEKAPIVGDINARLSNLYKFDVALQKAVNRSKNLNLLGLGTKFGAAAAGSKGALVGILADLVDNPAIKSGVAINLDRLAGKTGGVIKNAKIPIASLIDYIREELSGGK